MSLAVAPSALLPDEGQQRRLFGEPIGLTFLVLTEAWERFSYYGMTAILVLYMSQALLLPGHVEQVAGFAAFRGGLEAVFGPMGTLALASQIYGLYSGLVYFTPVLGGWIADRFIGRRRAVMLGALMMSGGHIAMAFDASFLLALLLLIVGCGFLKGNISAQVGQLYPRDDAERRTRAFAIFSTGINIGAILGPLACGLLAQLFGWHAGFAAAGALMLLGLATYIAGYRYLPDPAVEQRAREAHEKLSAQDWKTIALLLLVIALTVFHSIIYYQNANMALVWIDRSVALDYGSFHIPVPWFVSIDPIASVLGVPLLLAFWRRQAVRGKEPSEMGKIVIGLGIATIANLLLVIGSRVGPPVPVIFPIAYDLLLGVSFLYYWPTLLALVSRVAPRPVNATMMGVAFLSLFVSYSTIGWLGGFYERMTPTGFWTMNVAIGVVGLVVLLALKRPIERRFARPPVD
jgi:POT family proton-dependent oligopeptide transporter